jgi:hypothetical protein
VLALQLRVGEPPGRKGVLEHCLERLALARGAAVFLLDAPLHGGERAAEEPRHVARGGEEEGDRLSEEAGARTRLRRAGRGRRGRFSPRLAQPWAR